MAGLEIPVMCIWMHLVAGWPTPLNNDGVRQWEGWHPIYGKYKMFETTNQALKWDNHGKTSNSMKHSHVWLEEGNDYSRYIFLKRFFLSSLRFCRSPICDRAHKNESYLSHRWFLAAWSLLKHNLSCKSDSMLSTPGQSISTGRIWKIQFPLTSCCWNHVRFHI